MKLEDIRSIGVVGAGTMGGGIAQLFGCNGYQVVLVDRENETLARAMELMLRRSTQDQSLRLKILVSLTTDLQALCHCDLLIEAIAEEESAKRELLSELERLCRPDALFASNTSAISIGSLAKALKDPSRLVGMHFMNPPVVMRLVEVIAGPESAVENVTLVRQLAEKLGKVTAHSSDTPGFIANRLLFAFLAEAFRLAEQGVASKEDIDTVMRYGLNHPMGPFELADYIGLDVCQRIMTYLYQQLGDEHYRPGQMLQDLVESGHLGRKCGSGFFTYR